MKMANSKKPGKTCRQSATSKTPLKLRTIPSPGLEWQPRSQGAFSRMVAAARFGADIICIGSHPRAGFTAKVLDSVSLG